MDAQKLHDQLQVIIDEMIGRLSLRDIRKGKPFYKAIISHVQSQQALKVMIDADSKRRDN